jgi:predicted membrane protein
MSDENKFDGKSFGEDLRDQIHRDVHNSVMEKAMHSRQTGGIITGLILVAIGSIFLLDHMGIIRAETFWEFWPLILVAIGLNKLLKREPPPVGIAFILVGAILQLHELGLTRLSWNMIWPFVLILAGVLMIWSRFETPRLPRIPGSPSAPGAAADSSNMLNEYALFGGVERRVNVSDLRGGSISAIFGGVELDFRSADIEGEEAVVFVEAIFGGVEIVVPDRWNVTFQIQSIFAGYSDERTPPVPDPLNTMRKKNLILRGRAVFGGIVVKN